MAGNTLLVRVRYLSLFIKRSKARSKMTFITDIPDVCKFNSSTLLIEKANPLIKSHYGVYRRSLYIHLIPLFIAILCNHLCNKVHVIC